MSDSTLGWRPGKSSEPREVTKPKPFVHQLGTAKELALIAILKAPLQLGESAHVGFARKEREVRAAFEALNVLESRTVHARLSNPRDDDRLASLFMRMTHERRARLLTFLADARRRDALRCGRECSGVRY